MTTVLTALNDVLRILGETELATAATEVTTDEDKIVLGFFNQIKEEVEDAHNWRALRSFESVTLLANGGSINIPNANERSRLWRIAQGDVGQFGTLVFDITDTTNPSPLVEMDLAVLIRHDKLDPDGRQDPAFFALDNSAGDSMDLKAFPRPTANIDLDIGLIIPQDRIADNAITTVISVPSRPIIMGTLWFALEERGEELGINGIYTEQRYRNALDDAIARDSAESGDTVELVAT